MTFRVGSSGSGGFDHSFTVEVNQLDKYLAVAVLRTYDRRGIDALARRSCGKASVLSTMKTVLPTSNTLNEMGNRKDLFWSMCL